MNRVALPALLTLALSCAALPAQAATTPQTPAVLGTVPLAGVDARPMQAYTVGKGSPLNFTLQKAEYSVGRVVIGQSVVTPTRSCWSCTFRSPTRRSRTCTSTGRA